MPGTGGGLDAAGGDLPHHRVRRPRRARGFFEALIADNPGIGRPHNVEIIFARKVRRDTQGVFRTAIDRRDNGGVLVSVFCKHSRIKQYLKEGRAMRIETVVNVPATWAATPACAPGQMTYDL
jgi:plasmid stabilization system protein ParE